MTNFLIVLMWVLAAFLWGRNAYSDPAKKDKLYMAFCALLSATAVIIVISLIATSSFIGITSTFLSIHIVILAVFLVVYIVGTILEIIWKRYK